MTPKEKNDKRQRLAVQAICNKLISYFSLKSISTWRDVYTTVGYDSTWINSQPNCDIKVTIDDVKSFCTALKDNLNKQLGETNDNATRVETVKNRDNEYGDNGQGNDSVVTEPVLQKLSIVSDNPPEKPKENIDSDYGLVHSEKEKANLYYFQKKSAAEILYKLIVKRYRAVMLIAAPGSGKTFIQGAVDRRLKDMNFHKGKTWGHMPYIAITRNSVVEQTKRVLKSKFGIDPITETEVINIEKLRTRAGQIWIEEIKTIEEGEEVTNWLWKPMINPCVLLLDECQSVKNPDSTQSKIIMSYLDIPDNTTVIFISATPGQRVADFKAFACATRKDISTTVGIPGARLTSAMWPTYAKAICGENCDPEDYNATAVDRLMDDLDDYIVRVKGVRWQFNAINSVRVMDFPPANAKYDARKEFNSAWERYLARKAKLMEQVTDNPGFLAMIELGQLLMAAEYSKRYIFAAQMVHDVKEGYAAALAVKNKQTIIAVIRILIEDYGISRDNISLIWGGGQTQLSVKQKLKKQVMANKDIFDAAGVTLEDMMLDDVQDRNLEDIPKEYRLGNQNKEERQREIDKFQSGQSLYCIYTYKAGGVGLSLHHTDELCTRWNESVEGFKEWKEMIDKWNQTHKNPKDRVEPGKVRHKESGYAYEEDIKYVWTRPRKVTIGPCWSGIDLVQGSARAGRLNSLSNTLQEFLFFKGTVEEEQSSVVMHRLRCLTKVVRSPGENWYGLIEKYENRKEVAEQMIKEWEKDETDEAPTDLGDGNTEEDEE